MMGAWFLLKWSHIAIDHPCYGLNIPPEMALTQSLHRPPPYDELSENEVIDEAEEDQGKQTGYGNPEL
jgi:hypothetical protein